MLTPLGIALRHLRACHIPPLRQLDVAAHLGCTPAFLSAIEMGHKPVPYNFVERIIKILNLSELQKEELEIAISKTRNLVRIEHLNEANKTLVAVFASRIDKLSPEEIEVLKKTVKYKSISGERPFQRKRRGFAVRSRSIDEIRELAEKVRSLFVEDDDPMFPVMDVLEFRWHKIYPEFFLNFDWKERITNGRVVDNDEGRVYANSDTLTLREDVYRDAWAAERSDPFVPDKRARARFTACHELGHWLMHRNVGHVRMLTEEDLKDDTCDSEWQADVFAGELLVSRRHLDMFANERDLAQRCRISLASAQLHWTLHGRSKGRRSLG